MSRPKRLANRSYVGQATYFLTFCVLDRRPVFKEAAAASDALKHFQRTATEESFDLLAYVVMPDHAHLLAKGVDKKSDLRHFAKTVKERSGRSHRKRSGQQLWQEGYFDRVLRDAADARKYARYIVSDPVRAGLVATPKDYPFVGCTEWSFEELMAPVSSEADRSKGTDAGLKEQARPTLRGKSHPVAGKRAV